MTSKNHKEAILRFAKRWLLWGFVLDKQEKFSYIDTQLYLMDMPFFCLYHIHSQNKRQDLMKNLIKMKKTPK